MMKSERKNYRSLDEFYKEKFGCKVFKVSIDSGFSCPNKDGVKGSGGCIFCNGSTLVKSDLPDLISQFEATKEVLHRKWKTAKYIPFLEANTNTYASLETLKNIYEPLISIDDVVGLSIATRCDAISEEVYDYLADLNKRTYLTVELGLQSSNDDSLKRINRGHTKNEFTECVRRLKELNIDVVVHIINGLPGEDEDTMLETVRYVDSLEVAGIKFHMLYIERDTKLAELYKNEPFPLLSREEYASIVGKQLALLDESVVVHRLLSGPNNEKLIEPKWLLGKFTNLNYMENYLRENSIFQGMKK